MSEAVWQMPCYFVETIPVTQVCVYGDAVIAARSVTCCVESYLQSTTARSIGAFTIATTSMVQINGNFQSRWGVHVCAWSNACKLQVPARLANLVGLPVIITCYDSIGHEHSGSCRPHRPNRGANVSIIVSDVASTYLWGSAMFLVLMLLHRRGSGSGF